jgi:hypothetical protein
VAVAAVAGLPLLRVLPAAPGGAVSNQAGQDVFHTTRISLSPVVMDVRSAMNSCTSQAKPSFELAVVDGDGDAAVDVVMRCVGLFFSIAV